MPSGPRGWRVYRLAFQFHICLSGDGITYFTGSWMDTTVVNNQRIFMMSEPFCIKEYNDKRIDGLAFRCLFSVFIHRQWHDISGYQSSRCNAEQGVYICISEARRPLMAEANALRWWAGPKLGMFEVLEPRFWTWFSTSTTLIQIREYVPRYTAYWWPGTPLQNLTFCHRHFKSKIPPVQ